MAVDCAGTSRWRGAREGCGEALRALTPHPRRTLRAAAITDDIGRSSRRIHGDFEVGHGRLSFPERPACTNRGCRNGGDEQFLHSVSSNSHHPIFSIISAVQEVSMMLPSRMLAVVCFMGLIAMSVVDAQEKT